MKIEMSEELTIALPEGYESGTSRHPLLLALDPGLPAVDIVESLRAEGILPPMIVAARTEGSKADAADLITHLISTYRILEAPEARWICGTGHSAAEAVRCLFTRPDLAGRAACLSTSFEGKEGAPPLHSRLLRELEERTDLPAEVKLVLDYGTLGLDECYEPYHRDAGAIFRGKGWRDDREFRITRTVGGSHDSASWQNRLGPALRWLAGR
jgi:hypothetical protein